MLTRSPIQSSPANASPLNPFHVFHYAPASSPRHSPSSSRCVSASLNRSQSSPGLSASAAASAASSTTASPSSCPPPLKRYVAVDASTQYSPMDSAAESVAAVASPTKPTQFDIPSTTATAPEPSGSSDEQPTQSTAEPSSSLAKADAPGTTLGASKPVAQILSPNKRRKSQSPHKDSTATGTEVSGRPPSPVKRAKQETAPKILPQRYELCQVEDVVILVANLLCELIETNDKLALKTGHLTRFHSR